jgi:HrpA-like RNA helicase
MAAHGHYNRDTFLRSDDQLKGTKFSSLLPGRKALRVSRDLESGAFLENMRTNQVTILVAGTGTGNRKTPQIPQVVSQKMLQFQQGVSKTPSS